jgi:hypothetical protein
MKLTLQLIIESDCGETEVGAGTAKLATTDSHRPRKTGR